DSAPSGRAAPASRPPARTSARSPPSIRATRSGAAPVRPAPGSAAAPQRGHALSPLSIFVTIRDRLHCGPRWRAGQAPADEETTPLPSRGSGSAGPSTTGPRHRPRGSAVLSTNRERAIATLVREGALHRADLARRLSVSRTTASNVVQGLRS